MNLIQIKKPGKTTLVMVVINAGSFNEIDSYKGISHFVEHMSFKGNPKRNQKQISSAIDNVGGDLNAFTDLELTAYWAKVGNSYKDLAIEVITDLATKPLFPDKEIDKEREVIIQELKMYEDDAKDYVYEVFNKTLYAKQSGFYLPIVGTKETLHNIDRDTLINYYKEKYNNPTLIIVGDVMDKVNIRHPYDIKYIPSELAIYKDKTLIKRDNLTQANILVGNSVKLSRNKTEQMFCLMLLDALYGDMSGRLFDSLREKNNLVYRVHFDWNYHSNGTIQWMVSAGLDTNKINKARDLIIKELIKPISKKDEKILLNKTIGIQEMDLDKIDNLTNMVANSLINGTDYEDFIVNYKKNLNHAIKKVNDFIKEMKFNNNILVGVIPK